MKMAVIATGGKQYLVKEGDTLTVEKLAKEGTIQFETLMVDDGTTIDLKPGTKVTGSVTGSGKHDTVLVVRYKQKSRYHKKRGHRQPFTTVTIEKI